jgi:hypothetical protein
MINEFCTYANCEMHAKRNSYEPSGQGWVLGAGTVLRYHEDGSFRLFLFGDLVRIIRP